MGDVALDFDSIDAVLAGRPSMGAFIGRFASRIRNARFPLNGAVATLSVNASQHSLHRRHAQFASGYSPRASPTTAASDDVCVPGRRGRLSGNAAGARDLPRHR